jgi:hypothetical protein
MSIVSLDFGNVHESNCVHKSRICLLLSSVYRLTDISHSDRAPQTGSLRRAQVGTWQGEVRQWSESYPAKAQAKAYVRRYKFAFEVFCRTEECVRVAL